MQCLAPKATLDQSCQELRRTVRNAVGQPHSRSPPDAVRF